MTDLYVTRFGTSGPRVVFLHGLFGQGKNWTSIAKSLIAPIDGVDQAQVLLVDLPDHGRSSWSEEFSYGRMAETIADLLRTEGGGEPYAVIGHSMGGKVAMRLALDHPELVSRLCVVDISPVAHSSIRAFVDYVAGLRSIDLTTLPDRATADRALLEAVPNPTIRGFLLQNLRRDPSDGTWRWQMNLQLLGDNLDDIGGWPDSATPPYDGPTLWLAGSESDYVQPEYDPAMRALFPRVRLVTVKGAGHWVHSERPEVFLAAIRQFLHLTARS